MNSGPPHSVVMAAGPARHNELQQLLDDERVNDGARDRRDRFWLGRIEQEAMTLPGLLIALAESGVGTLITTVGGRTHHGRITAVGIDLVALLDDNGAEVLLPLGRVQSVRTPGRHLIAVDREPSPMTFRDQLLVLTEQRADVRLGLDGGTHERGTLVACGTGVVAIRTANRELTYVSEQHIAEIVTMAP